MSVQNTEFRDAMAMLGSAVNVVTTDGPAGKCGFTCTAVCSVTDAPGTLVVCLNRGSEMNKVFRKNGKLCVNILSGEQEALSARFAGMDGTPMAERFADDAWFTKATGAPVNREALASLDCNIDMAQDCGTHTVFFCNVEAMHFGQSDHCLVYWARNYYRLTMNGGVT